MNWKQAREIWDVIYYTVAVIGWIVFFIALASGRIEIIFVIK